jgi:hypothetical protein
MRRVIILAVLVCGCDTSVISSDGLREIVICDWLGGPKCIHDACPDGFDLVAFNRIVKCKPPPPKCESKMNRSDGTPASKHVFKNGGSWWFETEDESEIGPYPTVDAADDAFKAYCREVLGCQ